MVLDAKRRLVDINPSAQRLCSNDAAVPIGAQADQFLPPPVLAALERGSAGPTEVSFHYGATLYWYDLTLSSLYDNNGDIRGWVLTLHDITELRKARQEAEEAREEAEAANATKSQFISNISHELRTPLTSIKLYTNLMRSGVKEKQEAYLEILDRETMRLQEQIEDLLYISRLDLEKITFHPTDLSINDLIQTLVQDRALLFEERNLDLNYKPSPLPPIQADPTLLERLLTNLLINARNYTPQGSVTVRTAVVGNTDAPWITISVEDTGLGISEEDQARLFERFYRGSSSQRARAPGTGLGLAISQKIAALHGGHITCESKVGEGSTFTLWLPVASPSPKEPAPSNPIPPA
jgi:signal transduction histidine kinase